MLTPKEIRDIRLALGLSGLAFAERLGVHEDTIWKWERGDRHPTYSRMVKLNALKKEADAAKPQPA